MSAKPLTPEEERRIRATLNEDHPIFVAQIQALVATLDAARAAGASLAKIVDELREEIRKRDAAAIVYTDMVSEQMREMTNRAIRYEREVEAWRAWVVCDDEDAKWSAVLAARAVNEEAERG